MVVLVSRHSRISLLISSILEIEKILTFVRKGDIILKLNVNGKLSTCTFKNELFIPESGFQLISIRVLDKIGFVIQFGKNRVTSSKHKNSLLQVL